MLLVNLFGAPALAKLPLQVPQVFREALHVARETLHSMLNQALFVCRKTPSIDSLTIMLGIDERALRIAWTIFLFGLLLVVVYYIRGTILLFAGSIFLAYMLSPIVALVERSIPQRRNLALALVYIVLIGLLVLLGFELVPALNAEATSLVTRLPSLVIRGSL